MLNEINKNKTSVIVLVDDVLEQQVIFRSHFTPFCLPVSPGMILLLSVLFVLLSQTRPQPHFTEQLVTLPVLKV